MDLAGNDRDSEGGYPADSAAMTSALDQDWERPFVDGGGDEGDDLEQAQAAAATFVTAVAWGEHLRVWDLFTAEARRVVLRVAVARGMDERLAARLREGTAAPTERDTFLADLVNGLRADLRGTDLDALDFQPDPDWGHTDRDRARIMLMAPMINPLLGAPLPVASLELALHDGQWRIEHLLPRAQT